MFTVYFRETAPRDYDEAKQCDREASGRFFRGALNGGVYLPPSQFEAAFLSARLTDGEVDLIADAISAALVAANVD